MIIEDLNAEEYHAGRGEHLTSHLLIDAHRGNFAEALVKKDGDSVAYAFGRASHVLILEGSFAFFQDYKIGGPVNPRTGKSFGRGSQKFRDQDAMSDKPLITPEEFAILNAMRKKLRSIKTFCQLMDAGRAELTIRGVYCDVPVQIRMDWLSDFAGRRLLDLKTSSELFGFRYDAQIYGYKWQAAFYRAVARIEGWETMPTYIAACEKSLDPHAYVLELDSGQLDKAERENESMIEQIKSVFFENRERILREKEECQQI